MFTVMQDPRLIARLSSYPWVVVRLGCRVCKRSGSYRLARLAESYGAETSLDSVLLSLTIDCPFRAGGHAKRQKMEATCEARFVDIGPAQPPPDLPPGLAALRIVAGTDLDEAG